MKPRTAAAAVSGSMIRIDAAPASVVRITAEVSQVTDQR
jgi:hypothetical protein